MEIWLFTIIIRYCCLNNWILWLFKKWKAGLEILLKSSKKRVNSLNKILSRSNTKTNAFSALVSNCNSSTSLYLNTRNNSSRMNRQLFKKFSVNDAASSLAVIYGGLSLFIPSSGSPNHKICSSMETNGNGKEWSIFYID